MVSWLLGGAQTGLERVLYLHNSELRRAPISFSGAAGSARLASGGSALAHSFKLVFSTVRAAPDIFKVCKEHAQYNSSSKRNQRRARETRIQISVVFKQTVF